MILTRVVLDPQSVQLWRYEDPHFGDLKIPVFNEPTAGKVLIPADAKFKVDLEGNKVSIVTENDSNFVGHVITYLI